MREREREREKEKDFEDDFLLTKSFSFFVETFFSFHAPAKERQAGRQVLEKHRDCKRQRERERKLKQAEAQREM